MIVRGEDNLWEVTNRGEAVREVAMSEASAPANRPHSSIAVDVHPRTNDYSVPCEEAAYADEKPALCKELKQLFLEDFDKLKVDQARTTISFRLTNLQTTQLLFQQRSFKGKFP